MISLSKILDVGCVRLNLVARNKEEAITEMAELLVEAGKIADSTSLIHALTKRERMVSTGIGEGIAIPHAMLAEVHETVLALGRKKEGLSFGALDRKPVRLIFLLVGPENQATTHLQVLSRLARFLRDPGFRDMLLETEEEEKVLRFLREWEEREG
jgi:fructose-specific phosphotransferase system IIA component